jgi:hypothetical protein
MIIHSIPLIGVFCLTMVVVLVSIAAGNWFGLGRSKRSEEGEEGGAIGATVGAMLGLLAFIIAFTFGAAASRFDTRKQLLLDEVNTISTAILRTELLPEPQQSNCRRLLTSYVNLRANLVLRAEDLPRVIAESQSVLDELWKETTALSKADMDSEIRSLFVQSMNEVIDLHNSRVIVGSQYRIPGFVWACLGGATVFSMFAVGYQFGLSKQRKLLIHLLLALIFSSVVLLIADLDRATEGFVKVDQQPMLDLQKELNDARD